MSLYKCKKGVTLIEMLVVVAVIAILAAAILSVSTRIENKTDEQLTQNTLGLINTALRQFQEYGFKYYGNSDYTVFRFPLDCNGFTEAKLEGRLSDCLGSIPVVINADDHNDLYSGCEAMYILLSRVPGPRQILENIDRALVTNKDAGGADMTVRIDIEVLPLYRIIDPWGNTLRYDYYDENETNDDDRFEDKRTFPIVTSAGADGIFDTKDDIANR